MAKFKDIQYEALGTFIRSTIKDPELAEVFKSGSQAEIKDLLRPYMTPLDKSWDEITIVAHFDEDNVVNIAFPFTGDVERTVEAIAPATGPGEDYVFPDHYTFNPNSGMTDAEKRTSRLRAYASRLGDYVMTRCK